MTMLMRTRVLAKTFSTMAIFLFLGSLALSAPSTVPAAPSAAPAAKLTVGDFLLLYARSIHMALPPNASAETAYQALKATNVLPPGVLALDRPMTHGDVVRIGRAAGLRIS